MLRVRLPACYANSRTLLTYRFPCVDGVVHERIENEEFADLTDFRLRSFRYPV